MWWNSHASGWNIFHTQLWNKNRKLSEYFNTQPSKHQNIAFIIKGKCAKHKHNQLRKASTEIAICSWGRLRPLLSWGYHHRILSYRVSGCPKSPSWKEAATQHIRSTCSQGLIEQSQPLSRRKGGLSVTGGSSQRPWSSALDIDQSLEQFSSLFDLVVVPSMAGW